MLDGFIWRHRLSETRSLLKLEKSLLMKGQLDELTRLDRRRTVLEGHLTAMPEDVMTRNADRVEEIRNLAARNHRLLAAYLEGARLAVARLQEIDAARAEIGAYLEDGTKLDVKPRITRVHQKA